MKTIQMTIDEPLLKAVDQASRSRKTTRSGFIRSAIEAVRGIPSEVLLTEADGLPKTCAVNFDNLQTVPKQKLGKLITHLSSMRMRPVAEAAIFSLDLDGL